MSGIAASKTSKTRRKLAPHHAAAVTHLTPASVPQEATHATYMESPESTELKATPHPPTAFGVRYCSSWLRSVNPCAQST